MDLSKIEKDRLEDMFVSLIDELKSTRNPLADKYRQAIEDEIYCISDEDSSRVVKHMKPYGECYTKHTVTEILEEKGIAYDDYILNQYYICMNMMYNDYKAVADNYGIELREFCFLMSKMFITDLDGPKHKVAKYIMMD